MKNCDSLGEIWYEVEFDVTGYVFFIRFSRFNKSDSRYLNRICEILVKLE